MKDAIVQFYNLPKKVESLHEKGEKTEKLKKICEKRKVQLIQANYEEKKWKIKVNFDK